MIETTAESALFTDGMRRLCGGRFWMGSEGFYSEEGPVREAEVEPFWIDETPVTNAAFQQFVEATGYVTFAERPPDPKDYPGIPLELTQAGSLVFQRTEGPVRLDDARQWWRPVVGADWRHPLGPSSSLEGLENHPVVQVAYEDAAAYAAWLGKALPTEAEWEYAARGGLERAEFAWGDELNPNGAMLANYWQGDFPFENDLIDGWERTSPVGAFAANGYGLFDMIGNVWEWTDSSYSAPDQPGFRGCCAPTTDVVGGKVIKGGSHLCAPNYCQRYRPAARLSQSIDTSTGHIGFRCVLRTGHW